MNNTPKNDNKYKVGETIFAKATPEDQLIVRRYTRRIYYCMNPQKTEEKDVVLFEREILNQDPKSAS